MFKDNLQRYEVSASENIHPVPIGRFVKYDDVRLTIDTLWVQQEYLSKCVNEQYAVNLHLCREIDTLKEKNKVINK